jgi:hypothetical protein
MRWSIGRISAFGPSQTVLVVIRAVMSHPA